MVATVHQHGTDDSGGLRKEISQTKDAERRDKKSIRTGEDIGPGRAGENLPKAGDVKNDTAGL